MSLLKIFLASVTIVLLIGCEETKSPTEIVKKPIAKPVEKISKNTTPDFNADTAFNFIQSQLDFGFRIPNTPEHDSCAVWMKQKLTEYGFKLTIQTGRVKAWTGNMLNIENIIAQYNPEATNRIMLCTHWDTRPYADRGVGNKTKPIPGANDGGSGVGVLLEIARQISLSKNRC